MVESRFSERSFTYRLNRMGPRMEHCGTPKDTSVVLDIASSICTNCRLPVR